MIDTGEKSTGQRNQSQEKRQNDRMAVHVCEGLRCSGCAVGGCRLWCVVGAAVKQGRVDAKQVTAGAAAVLEAGRLNGQKRGKVAQSGARYMYSAECRRGVARVFARASSAASATPPVTEGTVYAYGVIVHRTSSPAATNR